MDTNEKEMQITIQEQPKDERPTIIDYVKDRGFIFAVEAGRVRVSCREANGEIVVGFGQSGVTRDLSAAREETERLKLDNERRRQECEQAEMLFVAMEEEGYPPELLATNADLRRQVGDLAAALAKQRIENAELRKQITTNSPTGQKE